MSFFNRNDIDDIKKKAVVTDEERERKREENQRRLQAEESTKQALTFVLDCLVNAHKEVPSIMKELKLSHLSSGLCIYRYSSSETITRKSADTHNSNVTHTYFEIYRLYGDGKITVIDGVSDTNHITKNTRRTSVKQFRKACLRDIDEIAKKRANEEIFDRSKDLQFVSFAYDMIPCAYHYTFGYEKSRTEIEEGVKNHILSVLNECVEKNK